MTLAVSNGICGELLSKNLSIIYEMLSCSHQTLINNTSVKGGVMQHPALTETQWCAVCDSASKRSIRSFVITEKAPTRAFSWLKAATTAFTFKTLLSLRHYAKRALTPRSLNVKLGPRRNYHKGRAAIRHYANQTACPS